LADVNPAIPLCLPILRKGKTAGHFLNGNRQLSNNVTDYNASLPGCAPQVSAKKRREQETLTNAKAGAENEGFAGMDASSAGERLAKGPANGGGSKRPHVGRASSPGLRTDSGAGGGPPKSSANSGGVGAEPPPGFNYTQHNCNKPRRVGKGCGKRTLVGLVDGKFVHHRLRCKSYSCAICGPRKIRQVRKRIVKLAVEHQLQRFLTLTLDPKKMQADLDAPGKIKFLKETWRKMRVSLERKLQHPLVFVSVLELQSNGNPHLHLLVGSYLPKEWISSAWQAVGGGWATRIEYADLHRVAAYLAKYLTEDSVSQLPAGTRRFSASRGLALFDRSKGNAPWVLVNETVEYLRGCCADIVSESFETEPDGARALVSFTANEVLEQFIERLAVGGAPLAIEVSPRRSRVRNDA